MSQPNTAMIIIDMMNKMDFVGGEDLLENTKPIMDNLVSLKKKAKEAEIPVIYVNDNFGQWQDNAENIIEECMKNPGKEIVEQILPEEDDYFIIKPKHSGFFGTQLDILLHQLGIDNLILTGVAGDICVLFTANDAYMREYKLFVPEDCMASEKVSDNKNAIHLIRRSLDADTTKSTELDLKKTVTKR
ncbi:isochorismatase family cysteine hydrolase [Jeotgalibacillus proteolyticus]|uniref:Isochorismatase n=1 Tax=Jeotgalibacillus proteolyticus TaxID=2082395 RepID=A0A2S5GD57_9BACL|nr:isochorismatase family cysteine hydrolase [Jeotgalibacillus proteolyticus]PPA70919.1 isochorismatase [Jeotgalibacillus proteolyticus]